MGMGHGFTVLPFPRMPAFLWGILERLSLPKPPGYGIPDLTGGWSERFLRVRNLNRAQFLPGMDYTQDIIYTRNELEFI